MKHKLLFILLLCSTLTFSQQEASVWYFGKNAGIKFQTDGSVTPLLDGQLNTYEGCATLSDNNGDLLFYTDGITVYNKNHQVMVNGTGLKGHTSSSQSATIVQKPGSPNLFYIFTAPIKASGAEYNEIDMTLDGGLGAVTANKNVTLYTPVCEKLSVVKHANGIDYWIVTHGWKNNSFYSHLMTSSGISSLPIISNSGVVVHDGSEDNTVGYMKISPNGKKLVACHQVLRQIQLFDFDTSTGIVSNPVDIDIINDYNLPYGAEFSPNSQVLYVDLMLNGQVYQYDLNAPDIALSQILIADVPWYLGALQLGPNNKIYIANNDNPSLGVINNPNILGLGCDLQTESVNIGERISMMGLPAFPQSYFNPSFTVENVCLGASTQFTLNASQNITSASWDFGDGTTSNSINPTHIYSVAGTYTVSVTGTNTTGTNTTTKDIIIYKIPNSTKPLDILICDDNNDGLHTFDLTTQNAAILNGQDPNLYKISYFANNISIPLPNAYANTVPYQQETITAEVSNIANTSCKNTTTFVIDVFDSSLPEVATLIPDLNFCDNTSVGTDTDGLHTFDLTQSTSNILNGQPASQFVISYYKDAGLTQPILAPTTYKNTNPTETIFVKMANKDNPNCTAMTSFKIEVFALPVINYTVDLKQCDDNIDGFTIFNLEEAISKITSNASVETFTFFKTALDAQNNTNSIPNPTNYVNQVASIDKVFVKVTNNNDCFRIAQLNLFVSTTQIPLTFQREFSKCDDAISGSDTDGIASFDFSMVTNQIQNIFPAGQQLNITYYKNLADVLAEKDAISDISNYSNTGYPNTQNIYIRVDSKLGNDCLGLGSHITLKVNPLPEIQFTGDELVCSNLPAFTKIINAGLLDDTQKSNFSYIWTLDGNPITGETNYDLTVNKKGIYQVNTADSQGCSRTRTITVNASDKATVKLDIVELSSENSITVLAAGTGDYVFSLDNENGDYQTGNVFYNVPSGIHSVFVKDLNGCGIVSEEIALLGIPKFFTPNQDSHNDTWNIKGVNGIFNLTTSIRIFDRYGKLLKEINPLGDGWDGTFNGQQMPSTDYWYSVQLQDGRIFKGHFALKR